MKRLTALFTLAALISCLLCPALAEETDYEAVYAPVLASIAHLLSQEYPEEHIAGPGETGVMELRMAAALEDAPWDVGYALQDLSGDGIPELIIGQVDSQEVNISYGKQILAVYSCLQGSPSLVLEGWARNRYYLLPDGSLINQGSSGAAYSCLGQYQLAPGEAELRCLDYFFTWEENGQVVSYHNSNGVWDPEDEASEPVDLDFPRFSEIMTEDTQLIAMTAFAFYLMEEHPSLVQAYWNPYEDVENCIILSDKEYSTQIVLVAYQGAVTDLQLLSLELEDVDQEGNVKFKQTVLETIPTLEEGEPLVIQLEFGCSIPNFGFRCTDDTGVTKTYSLLQSGMDGSLLMNEIQ